MFRLDAIYELAKERNAEILKVAEDAAKVRAAGAAGGTVAWRKLALGLATMTVAAAVVATKVAAAAGGGGGGGPRLMF